MSFDWSPPLFPLAILFIAANSFLVGSLTRRIRKLELERTPVMKEGDEIDWDRTQEKMAGIPFGPEEGS